MLRLRKILFTLIPLSYLVLLLFQKDLAMIGDLGRHIKIGEIVTHCFCVPQTNLFSYTNPDFPIVNHEWLAEVIFYLTTVIAGIQGLLILKMIIILSSAILLYRVALKKGSLFWVTIFSTLCITLFSTRFFVLPEIFSYLFISLFIFLIEKYKQIKNGKLLWLLPILELLWVNMHLYFIIGIGMYGLFLVEEYFRHKKIKRNLLFIGIAMIIAIFINPSFIRGALLPFTIFHNYGLNVEENSNLLDIFNNLNTNGAVSYTLILQVLVCELLIVLFMITLFIKQNWKSIFQTGTGLFGMILGIKLVRCISLFALFGFMPLVQSFTYIETSLKKSMDKSVQDIVKGAIVLGLAIIVIIHVKGLLDFNLLGFNFIPSAENAVVFMNHTNLHGPIFNNYRIGNYLIYGLYPKERIFLDARPEAYPASFFDTYWKMIDDPAFFNQQVNKYHINAIVFNVDDDPVRIRPFLIRVLSSPDWIAVYGDGNVTIIARNNEENKTIIDNYRIPFHTTQSQ